MANLEVPTISVVIGEGSSGGALALGVTDKIIMLENSIYSILSPEGFASILFKDSSKSKEAAEKMKITAKDLKELGVIDAIIKEPLGTNKEDLQKVSKDMKKIILKYIEELLKLEYNELKEIRYAKYRNIR